MLQILKSNRITNKMYIQTNITSIRARAGSIQDFTVTHNS
jgi:hypothetical protein